MKTKTVEYVVQYWLPRFKVWSTVDDSPCVSLQVARARRAHLISEDLPTQRYKYRIVRVETVESTRVVE